jgi:ribosomal protein S18 acetylase RimI-like enzyme
MAHAHEELLLRPYTAADLEACCALFASNVPDFFLPGEVDDYRAYLAAHGGGYLVLLEEGHLAAAGGYAVSAEGEATLCFGLVERGRHRRGLGSVLLRERLRLASDPAVQRVQLNTSQHNPEFFSRFGFAVTAIRRDGYGPGLDRVDMALELTAETRARLCRGNGR